MHELDHLLSEPRIAKMNLSRALHERDQNAAFDRCMVGGENCKEPAIRAHCVPETALELIMNESRDVIAGHSQPPRTLMQWLNELPLKRMNIGRFNVGRWACRPHDDTFSSLDTKRLDTLTERGMFLMIYKATVYLTQRVLHAGERLATPLMDPAAETPQGLSRETQEHLKQAVRQMTFSAMRVFWIKQQMDRILSDETYHKIEYRATMWPTTPTMAAVGMVLADGPGNLVAWYGENSLIPVWMVLLPQEHGQTIITASPRGTGTYTQDIHEGMPKNRVELARRDDSWARLVCQKVLTNATDVAVSEKRLQQLQDHERSRLQEFILRRNSRDTRELDFPNILAVR